MTASPSYPDPDACPDTDVVIYDGDCQFCRTQVERLIWLDSWGPRVGGSERRLSYISLHDPRVAERYPDLTHDQLMAQMYVVEGRGGRHGGADAIRYLSRRLRILWPVMPILHFPMSARWWRWLYGQVARRRYQWNKAACEGDACAVHFGGGRRTDY